MTDARRDRMWSPLFGGGWLVWEDGTEARMRFDGDDGRVTRFAWHTLGVGSPPYVIGKLRTKPVPEGERVWMTVVTTDGATLMFRRTGTTERIVDVPALRGPAQPKLPGM